MGSHYLRKYGAATTIDFELYKLDGAGLKSDAASATHDIKIMKDEGAEADTTADAFVDEGQGYSLALTATEMTAARVVIYIVDQTSPQAWLDKVLIIETYGHASAQHAFDLDTSTVNLAADQSTVTIGTVNTAAALTTNNDKTGYALSTAGIDAVLDEVVESTLTLRQAIRLIIAATHCNKTSGGGTATLIARDYGDTLDRITKTVDVDGNTTAVSVNTA